MKYKLRANQEEATQHCVDIMNFPKPCAQLVVLPTGLGKGLVQAEVAKRIDFPLIILCPSKELLEQNHIKLKEFGVEHTVCSASVGLRDVSKLTLATIGSIKNNYKEFKELGIKGILIDEGHLMVKSGSMIRKFIKKAGITQVVGLTATPCVNESVMGEGTVIKMLNKVKWRLYTNIRYVYQIKDAVREGYWSPLKYKVVNSDETLLVSNASGSDYTLESQKSFYDGNDFNKKIKDELKELQDAGRKSTIIFVPSIEEAEKLYGEIPNSAIVHSKMTKEERIFMVESFKSLDIPVIISIGILRIGFDHPQLDSIIMASPTMSVNIYYQAIGRAVRLHEDKEDALIVDLSGNYGRFGPIENFTYEKLTGYGWGMFGKNDELLTDYPIAAENRPTKQSLTAYETEEMETVEFFFGKHKGKTVKEVLQDPKGKGYLAWIVDQKGFQWHGRRGHILRDTIYKALKLEVPEDEK